MLSLRLNLQPAHMTIWKECFEIAIQIHKGHLSSKPSTYKEKEIGIA